MEIYPVIDVEEHASMTKTAVASAVWSVTNRVYQRTGVRRMIYTSAGFWNSYVARNTWVHDFPLWVAHWNTSVPTFPDDWKNYGPPYKFWQTYVGQDGLEYGMQSKSLDHDVYNGEWEQFAQEFKLTEPQPEPETLWVDDFGIEKVYPMMVEYWGYTGPRPVKRE